jgi:GMP synthase-like glutamine amidotransferase
MVVAHNVASVEWCVNNFILHGSSIVGYSFHPVWAAHFILQSIV